jgi:hypothetical protein
VGDNENNMSREERKMAQIIASIERMEQKKLIKSDSTLSTTMVESDSMSEEKKENIDQLQTKARKSKSTKTLNRSSKSKTKSKRKDKRSSMNEKEYITPKKRWIMRWNALVAANPQEKEIEQEQEKPENEHSKFNSIEIEKKTTVAESSIGSQDQLVEKQSSKDKNITETDVAYEDQNEDLPVDKNNSSSESDQEKKFLSVQKDNKEVEVEKSPKTQQDLRVVAVGVPLHHSPAEEQSTAASTTLSISPSIKDTNAPSMSISKEKEEGEEEEVEIQVPSVAEKADVTNQISKRSLPVDDLSPDDFKWIEERRKKRKHNWDVGDPRLGYSPSEQRNFPSRPNWRHISRMNDTKSSSNPRNSAQRRFHHSHSLPFERSRSVGRFSRPNYNGNR